MLHRMKKKRDFWFTWAIEVSFFLIVKTLVSEAYFMKIDPRVANTKMASTIL